jgi:hypothetical protein
MNPFRVYLFQDYTGTSNFVIVKQVGLKTFVAKKVPLEFAEIPEGTMFREPTFSFNYMDSKDFLAALKEMLDGEKLPPSAVEGELKATKVHLEDMRKLVFEKTFPIQNIVIEK